MTMMFSERLSLKARGPNAPIPDVPVEGTLLVGEHSVACWTGEAGHAGFDSVILYPAYYEGNRCFLMRKEWTPLKGYSGERGAEDSIISLEEGIKLACCNKEWAIFRRLGRDS